jgi:hypothetical protein
MSNALATAFFRLHILESLAAAPARPATLLDAAIHDEQRLPSGAFSRTLNDLLDVGCIIPTDQLGTVAITSLGRLERARERERWEHLLPAIQRILGAGR